MNRSFVLIDTSAWLMTLGRVNIPQVKNIVDQLLKENRAAITPIVYLELLGGTKSQKESNDLKSYLKSLYQLNINEKEWNGAAQLAFELRRQGKTIPYTDIIIAAVALQAGTLLLHADSHFDIIAETTDLAVDSLVSLIPVKKGAPKK